MSDTPNPRAPDLPCDWPEDYSHENGNYECRCIVCGSTFYGYKRRVVCKQCATDTPNLLVAAARKEHKITVRRDPVYDCSCGESFFWRNEAQVHRAQHIEEAKQNMSKPNQQLDRRTKMTMINGVDLDKPWHRCQSTHDGLQCDFTAGHEGKHGEVLSRDDEGRVDDTATWS